MLGRRSPDTNIEEAMTSHLEERPRPADRATPVVFIVDDDVSVRESLELMVRCQGWQPQKFASAQEFLDFPRALAPSCMVLDVHLPDLNGLDLQERVAAHKFALPIIFITGYGDVPMTVQAMKAGAVEFLTKPFDDEAMVSAIKGALVRSQAAVEDERGMISLREKFASLSRREREVMDLVASGLLNKQVGDELGISEITVKAHRGRVMQKMAADSLPHLVNIVARLRAAGVAGLTSSCWEVARDESP